MFKLNYKLVFVLSLYKKIRKLSNRVFTKYLRICFKTHFFHRPTDVQLKSTVISKLIMLYTLNYFFFNLITKSSKLHLMEESQITHSKSSI